jgi:energy-coupling factor transport system permease protein
VLTDALDRSLRLAAGMDSRGYGRSGFRTRAARRVTAGLLLAGMCGLCVGLFGLLDSAAPRALGMPAIFGGAALCCGGLALGGRRVRRTAYRRDPWGWREIVVAGAGLLCAALLIAGAGAAPAALQPTWHPLGWPSLPLIPVVAIVLSGLAALAAPVPVRQRRSPLPVGLPVVSHRERVAA